MPSLVEEVLFQDREEDERDSKDTRLTLMEEVLLLGLKESILLSNNNSFFFLSLQFRIVHSSVFSSLKTRSFLYF